MEPVNPITTKSPINPLGDLPAVPHPTTGREPAEHEIERRIQELVNAWLRNYFSGALFMTRSGDGGTVSKVFTECGILFHQAPMPSPQTMPILHLSIVDVRSDRCDLRAGYHGTMNEVTWNTLIRVATQPDSAPGGTQREHPEFLCREVADSLRWLLASTEREALSQHGINHVRLVRGPTVVPAGGMFVRQLVWTHRSYHEIGAPSSHTAEALPGVQVQNGDFDNALYWTLTGTSRISNGVAVVTATGGDSKISQVVEGLAGKTAMVEFDIIYSDGSFCGVYDDGNLFDSYGAQAPQIGYRTPPHAFSTDTLEFSGSANSDNIIDNVKLILL